MDLFIVLVSVAAVWYAITLMIQASWLHYYFDDNKAAYINLIASITLMMGVAVTNYIWVLD